MTANNDAMDEWEEEAREPRALPFWTVAIYLVDIACGGPEEGGWWYDYGIRCDDFVYGIEPIQYLTVFASREAAQLFVTKMNAHLDATANVGRREISSVLSDGRYEALLYNGYPPAFWPERTPRYE